MKRTCFGCRALITASRTRCELGYKQKTMYPLTLLARPAPAEECPKPRTYDAYFYWKQERVGVK